MNINIFLKAGSWSKIQDCCVYCILSQDVVQVTMMYCMFM